METVKIKHAKVHGNDSGYCVINKSDFDPQKHELYGVEQPAAGAGDQNSGKKDKKGKAAGAGDQ